MSIVPCSTDGQGQIFFTIKGKEKPKELASQRSNQQQWWKQSMNERLNGCDFTADYFHNHFKTYESNQSDTSLRRIPEDIVV